MTTRTLTTLLLAVCTAVLCCCGNNNEKRWQTDGSNKDCGNSLFSTSLLSGTSWIADLSDDERIYKISFTDITYIARTFYSATKHDYLTTYSYYLSNAKPRQFDWTKVGQKTSGDIIILHNKTSKDKKITTDKLLFISPQKLILLFNDVDTISFTRE